MTTYNFNNEIEFYKKNNYAQESDNLNYIRGFYEHFGFYFDKSIEGQYRLMYKDELGNEEYVAEDPSCEDTYDKDSAAIIFYSSAIEFIIKKQED